MAKRKADAPAIESDNSDSAPADEAPPVKRSRGRPKGSGKPKKIVDPDAPKRPRGRPRVNPPKDPEAPSKPRGRPPAVTTSSPKKPSPPKSKVTSRSSTPKKRGRPAKKGGRKPAPKPQEEEAEQSDE